MIIEILEARAEHFVVLDNLLELYQYDFTQFTGADVENNGRYGFDHLTAYLEEPGRHAFLVQVDGHWAGLALVRERVTFLDGGTGNDMAEFFIMRKYRRTRLGERLATTMFDRFRGPWQIREMRANEPAQAFWRAIVRRYVGTAAPIEELEYDDDRWRGPVQIFDSSVE